MPHPARVPVTAVLAIDRPLFLLGAAAGSDGTVRARSDVSGIPSTAISRKGPRVARPLAALAKYPGPVAGAVGPIEGPLVVLHGTGGAGSEESRQTAHGAAVGGGGGTGPAGEGGRERELAMQLEAVQKVGAGTPATMGGARAHCGGACGGMECTCSLCARVMLGRAAEFDNPVSVTACRSCGGRRRWRSNGVASMRSCIRFVWKP